MIELSKEKPYEDACKLLGLRPVANYKSYKLTRDTAKEFARICKPMIIKHLFDRDDHENFKFNF